MIATKETKSHALGIAEDGAKIADIAEAGARRPSPRGDGLARSLPREAADRRTSDDPPPSTPSARPPPKDKGSTHQAVCDESNDGREEEKREEGEDNEAPLPPEMVVAAFEEAKPELISDDGYAQVLPGQMCVSCSSSG